jgi:hypothetical protein
VVGPLVFRRRIAGGIQVVFAGAKAAASATSSSSAAIMFPSFTINTSRNFHLLHNHKSSTFSNNTDVTNVYLDI